MTIPPERSARRSPLAMAILLLLRFEPMHPYGLRQRIQDWDKDRTINVSQRNAVYQTVERLVRSDLIRLREVARQENRPERAIYETTEAGDQMAVRWLTEMLASPVAEFPAFPAALAFLQSLPRDQVVVLLAQRVDSLTASLRTVREDVAAQAALVPGGLDRIHLVEVDYQLAMWEAEIRWVEALLADLRAGRIWTGEQASPAAG